MDRMRRHWRATAGMLLAVAASPAAAQDAPAEAPPPALKADGPADAKTLPPPRPVVAPPAATPAAGPPAASPGPACGVADFSGAWRQWWGGHHAGCQANMWGYPEEFEAPPLGASVRANFGAMVGNGDAAGMVLYRYDFLDGGECLNTHGYDRLARMAARLPGNRFPIVIERLPEAPALAEARRAAVLGVLAREGVPVPPERVVIGPRLAVGLPGADAIRVYGYHLLNMGVQGQPVPLLSSGGTGAATGGGGGAFGPTGGGR